MDSHRPTHFSSLLQFLRRKGRCREDADDLIQEAMLRLHVYVKNNAVDNEERFLRKAVQNLAIDQYRHHRFRLSLEVPIDDVDQQDPLISPRPTPDRILDTRQRLDDVAGLLNELSPRTRTIYFAHCSGYTLAEIAEEMRLAEVTVRRHIARADLAVIDCSEKERQHKKPEFAEYPRAGISEDCGQTCSTGNRICRFHR